MRRFSERHGIIDVQSEFRRGEIDERMMNRLWSACDFAFWKHLHPNVRVDDFTYLVLSRIQDGFFGLSSTDLHYDVSRVVSRFRSELYALDWNEFFDFVQFMADFSGFPGGSEAAAKIRQQATLFIERCNEALKEERYGYRFVRADLSEITDEVQVSEIELAISIPDPYEPARSHLATALKLYAKRENPDYRNSIKESISCIESFLFVFNGQKSHSMKDSLNLAEQRGLQLHSALREAILKLFGWTSDEQGIRHALVEEGVSVSESHARFMLVVCSALLNFLFVLQGERLKN